MNTVKVCWSWAKEQEFDLSETAWNGNRDLQEKGSESLCRASLSPGRTSGAQTEGGRGPDGRAGPVSTERDAPGPEPVALKELRCDRLWGTLFDQCSRKRGRTRISFCTLKPKCKTVLSRVILWESRRRCNCQFKTFSLSVFHCGSNTKHCFCSRFQLRWPA